MMRFSTFAGWASPKQSALFLQVKVPTHVKVGYMCCPVWPYERKPLQCIRCHKLGHVAVSCVNGERSTKCPGSHSTSAGTSDKPQCINSGNVHDSTSPACGYLCQEKEVCELHSHEAFLYADACSTVKSRRRMTEFLKTTATNNASVSFQ